jgi:5-methylthioadenosine/S-adenosylhomocysteine deaminase
MPKTKTPIDPPPASQFVVTGRVVTMDDNLKVIDDGAVYVGDGVIQAVQKSTATAPAGFSGKPRLTTKGVIYPGLIDLHNHLSYNALRLWNVPRKFTNRDQWSAIPDYHQLISGPMGVLGKDASLVPAIVRYVECKCLLGGTTTTQGFALASNAGIRRYYRGIVRNVEQTGEASLPQATTRISDVVASSVEKFWQELQRSKSLILHLSEGTDDIAERHFTDLKRMNGSWAISDKLIGIHCVGLHPMDISTFTANKGHVVWSPLSNLLLYGATADVAGFKRKGENLALGCDWSPTGSKNLLGEMKVAHIYTGMQSPKTFSDEGIVAMVTRSASAMLGWDTQLGSLEPGKKADLIAIKNSIADPYAALVGATESHVVLVAIEGVPRYGLPSFIQPFNAKSEALTVGGRQRFLNLVEQTEDPDVAKVSLAQAKEALTKALHDLPNRTAPTFVATNGGRPAWTLALDETEVTHENLRLAISGPLHQTQLADMEAVAKPPLIPLDLDPLTVVDDSAFLDELDNQPNLPAGLAKAFRKFYETK